MLPHILLIGTWNHSKNLNKHYWKKEERIKTDGTLHEADGLLGIFLVTIFGRSAMGQVCVKHLGSQDEEDLTSNFKELIGTIIILSPKSSMLVGT